MTYLDRVLSETLRLYPPVIRMEQQCSRDYTLPDTNVHIPRGTIIQIGPRNCTGMRFALFEAKVALIAVLRENRLEPSKADAAAAHAAR
ncbi:cytochrome P450 3A12-like [Pollicipes pollicipes]|uniref:cytochrome P450 3A12-like n=1 Tax=Pollicipes pollicipes TaxID=41117 RepID=UPI001884E052|nr:cytochrome P450 3A12-like [Pollicipes pollicipes]